MGASLSIEVAKEIMSAAESAGSGLSVLGEAVRKIENDELRKQLLRHIGGMIADVYIEIMRPIIVHHPHLDPDKKE